MKKMYLMLLALGTTIMTMAQTAEEIVAKYLEVIGGKENILKNQTIRMEGSVKFGGMDLPMTMLKKPGKMKVFASFQGMTFVQACYDGSTLWATNQMNMQPEKSSSDDTYNMMMDLKEEPELFLTYKDLGYTLSREADEKIDGTDCHVVKVTKKPKKADGQDVDNIEFFYFDKESGAMLMQQETISSGPAKGAVQQTVFSDYREMNGMFIPFAMEIRVKGQPGGQTLTFTKVEPGADIDDKEFSFPGQ